MKTFIIQANSFLKKDTRAFYNTDYVGYKKQGNPDYINILKGTFENEDPDILRNAFSELEKVLSRDLPNIINYLKINNLTISIVPRAKAENTYKRYQVFFKKAIKKVVESNWFFDWTDYLTRIINTKTTHLKKPIEWSLNDWNEPYPWITKDTCLISNEVIGKNILLIDDIYTKTINIDEDAIQALLDKWAKSVCFYSVGKTV